MTLHISDGNCLVMYRLKEMHFLDDLYGDVFLSQLKAAVMLAFDLLQWPSTPETRGAPTAAARNSA